MKIYLSKQEDEIYLTVYLTCTHVLCGSLHMVQTPQMLQVGWSTITQHVFTVFYMFTLKYYILNIIIMQHHKVGFTIATAQRDMQKKSIQLSFLLPHLSS